MKLVRRLLRAISRANTASRQSDFEAPDVFAAGLFPVCPATHDLGIRRLFDLATLLLLLDCRPGDRVLDLGAGSGFSSEMLARLGYDTIAIDPDCAALGHTRRRLLYDRQRIEGDVTVVGSIAERLPFREASFDGVLGMNVLHHVPDVEAAVSEVARILRPGCRAVFAEPGLDHLEANETERAIREHGEDDRPFDVMHLLKAARSHGFQHAMLTATLQPPLRLLPLEEIELYRAGDHPRPHLTPEGVLDELHRRHPFAMLVREGARPKTSRHPGLLAYTLRLDGLPSRARKGAALKGRANITNTGDTIWEARPMRRGGFVTLGCKLTLPNGTLLNDSLGRTFLPHSVAPGESVSMDIALVLPPGVPDGEYDLRFDLVDELICWFGDASGAQPIVMHLTVS